MTAVMLTFGIIAVAAILLVYLGSTWFITPIRRGLEPRHLQLLSNPAQYGLTLQHIRLRTDDDFLLESILANRSPESGLAQKTRKMEKRLAVSGIADHANPRGTIILLHGRGGGAVHVVAVDEAAESAPAEVGAADERRDDARG